VGATASLSSSALQVEPGGTVVVDVRLRNTGTVVDQFSFEVLGDAAVWANADPPTLSLFPGAEGVARIRFTVPRSAEARSGAIPFAVKVSSKEDAAGGVVEEGTLDVSGFVAVSAELLPRTSHGGRVGRHELALDNRGNTRVNAVLTAADPGDLLRFSFGPPSMVAEPDTATFSKVLVRPLKTFWRGRPKTLPFQVSVEADGAAPITVDGSYLQEPRLPSWFWKVLLAVLALLLLLVILWFTLLKPTVESAAKEAVEEPLEQTEEALQDLAKQVGAAAPQIDTGGEQPAGTPAGAQAGAEEVETDLGNPFDARLAVNGPGVLEDAVTVGDKQVFSLTDIVLQNPAGDSGIVELKRGDRVLLRLNLANFRDLDYHFVSPVIVSPGAKVTLHVECASPACTTAVYLAGFVKTTGT
jgi:hypothetical protein